MRGVMFDLGVREGAVGDGGVQGGRFVEGPDGPEYVGGEELSAAVGRGAVARSDAEHYMGVGGALAVRRSGDDTGSLIGRTAGSGTL